MSNDKEYIIYIDIDDLIECNGRDEFNSIVAKQTEEDLKDMTYEVTGYSDNEIELTITGHIEEES